jgi:regulator of protease activity HflC (stomatin/prohibitin superfamily)
VDAFRTGASRVAIWFGWGELILWNPGQTFAFLRNKQLARVGSTAGGFRAIYSYRGEEAVGPIPMQSALFNWENENVLTRDGQPLKINIGVWWKVEDAEKYVFHIYSDRRTDSMDGNSLGVPAPPPPPPHVSGRTALGTSSTAGKFDPVAMHRIGDQWLLVITESTVRARINTLAVSEIVSAQAMQFLQHGPGAASNPNLVIDTFEAAIKEVLGEIQRKALDFGIRVERLEVQHVYLPKQIQDAINETRIAFLAPIRSEQEAEAQRIRLEKLVAVLGRDNVGLNEIMKNLRNANFMTPMPIFQPLSDKMSQMGASDSTKKLTDSERP